MRRQGLNLLDFDPDRVAPAYEAPVNIHSQCHASGWKLLVQDLPGPLQQEEFLDFLCNAGCDKPVDLHVTRGASNTSGTWEAFITFETSRQCVVARDCLFGYYLREGVLSPYKHWLTVRYMSASRGR